MQPLILDLNFWHRSFLTTIMVDHYPLLACRKLKLFIMIIIINVCIKASYFIDVMQLWHLHPRCFHYNSITVLRLLAWACVNIVRLKHHACSTKINCCYLKLRLRISRNKSFYIAKQFVNIGNVYMAMCMFLAQSSTYTFIAAPSLLGVGAVIGIVIGSLTLLLALLVAVISLVALRYRKYKSQTSSINESISHQICEFISPLLSFSSTYC